MNHRRFVVSFAIISLGALVVSGSLIASNTPTTITPSATPLVAEQASASTVADITDLAFYDGLPVHDVKTYTTEQAVGTIIFLPQYHQLPGSTVDHPRNDKAERLQKELHAVIERIVEETPVRTIAVEGELVGPVATSEKEEVAALLKLQRELQEVRSEIARVDSGQSAALLKQADELAATIARHIYLKGAPQVVWAEGRDVRLVGTEDSATREQSSTIVRNHIYLEDRLAQLNSKPLARAPRKTTANLNALSRNQLLQKLLLNATIAPTAASTLTDPRLTESQTAITRIANELKTMNRASSAKNGPSRADNPYQKETNTAKLRTMLQASEANINTVIIDQRNRDTVQSLRNTLQQNNEQTIMLQFGAGHQESIIEEMRRNNLNVIVIEVDELAHERQLNTK